MKKGPHGAAPFYAMETLSHHITGCRRCGTCCRKGGPALHLSDRDLVVSGKLPLATLYTIRCHEPAFDNVMGRIAPASTDIIKIKPLGPGQSTCLFYRRSPECSVYEQRPLECRVLQCWDTREIEAVYSRDRLTREHLLASRTDYWDLILEHQTRCDYERLADFAIQFKQNPEAPNAASAILAMLRYDHSLRETVKDQTGLAPALFDFLFGRPLTATLGLFGLKLVKTGPAGEYQVDVA
jgi:Fe-S-cluster containining protein